MKNELNVFTNGYLPWHPSNWWSNIKDFFRSFRRAWQRATKGYSDGDLWDLDFYYSNLMIASLSEFRAKVIGFPAYMESIEEWYAILDKIILLLKQSAEIEPLEEKNELAEWYEEYLETKHLNFEEVADGKAMRISLIKTDEETDAKRAQYFKREEELYNLRAQKRKEAFELMAEYFGNLWW